MREKYCRIVNYKLSDTKTHHVYSLVDTYIDVGNSTNESIKIIESLLEGKILEQALSSQMFIEHSLSWLISP